LGTRIRNDYLLFHERKILSQLSDLHHAKEERHVHFLWSWTMELNSFCINNVGSSGCRPISAQLLLIMQDLSGSTAFNHVCFSALPRKYLDPSVSSNTCIAAGLSCVQRTLVLLVRLRCMSLMILSCSSANVTVVVCTVIVLIKLHSHGIKAMMLVPVHVVGQRGVQSNFLLRDGRVLISQKVCPCGIYGWARFAEVKWKIGVQFSVDCVACMIEEEEVVEFDCREFAWQRSGAYCSRRSISITVYQVIPRDSIRQRPAQATFDNTRATLKDDFEIHDCRSFAGRLFSDSGVIRPTPASSSTSTESRRSRLYHGITFERLLGLGGEILIREDSARVVFVVEFQSR
ncbi:hypothetical protein KCU97_g3, partial [Aureobasidium melanogenum]